MAFTQINTVVGQAEAEQHVGQLITYAGNNNRERKFLTRNERERTVRLHSSAHHRLPR